MIATRFALAAFFFSIGAGGCSSAGNSTGNNTPEAVAPGAPTGLTGSLGSLGAVKPTVSSLVISNSGETLVYMGSVAITCEQLKVSRWLGMVTPGAQVIEIVVRGAPKIGSVDVPPNEVNYGEGGKSSAGEALAESGSITFTKAEANGVVEGTLTASYGGGASVQGHFHAEFCSGGQGY